MKKRKTKEEILIRRQRPIDRMAKVVLVVVIMFMIYKLYLR